jgi:hypothetical protein
MDLILTMNYLSVPALLKLNFSGNPTNSAYLKAGLMPSILVSKKATAKIGSASASSDDLDGLNSFDLPAVAGFGVALPLSTSVLQIEASYVRSLTPVVKEVSSSRNEGFLVTAGLGFEI